MIGQSKVENAILLVKGLFHDFFLNESFQTSIRLSKKNQNFLIHFSAVHISKNFSKITILRSCLITMGAETS